MQSDNKRKSKSCDPKCGQSVLITENLTVTVVLTENITLGLKWMIFAPFFGWFERKVQTFNMGFGRLDGSGND